MEAKELRIGNWVDVFIMLQGRVNVQVTSIDAEGINYVDGGYLSYIYDIKPVPLTEEILLKCGFDKINGYGFRKSGFILNGRKVKDSIGFHFTHYECTIECSYLHQLQNLYHALTNEELNVEL